MSETATKTEQHDSAVPAVQSTGTTAVFDYVSHPGTKNVCTGICRQCARKESVQADGPDVGVTFSCGMMVDANQNGITVGSCAHFIFSHLPFGKRHGDVIGS